MSPVEQRLGELMLYIAQQSQNDPTFGKTKLLKLLAHADFLAYERMGKSLTGAHYRKLDYGPAPHEFPATLGLFRAAGYLRVEDADVIDFSQEKVIAQRTPDLTGLFSPSQVSLVDEVLDRYRNMNARDISEDSHRHFVGWQVAQTYDEIPYYTVHMTREKPSAADVAWAERALADLES
jgi:hypothetical protein